MGAHFSGRNFIVQEHDRSRVEGEQSRANDNHQNENFSSTYASFYEVLCYHEKCSEHGDAAAPDVPPAHADQCWNIDPTAKSRPEN